MPYISTPDTGLVNKRLFEPFRDIPAKETDVGLLMGGRSTSGEIARAAATEYHKGRFSTIIVAGGKRIFEPMVFVGLLRDKMRGKPCRVSCKPLWTDPG